ncbi:DNA polymerase III, beta subunit (plasmid) [Stanieria cyanosphaera PCC 7437]|uniref:DNA polymerase III, beta subunit n=1 Tax=Stanieria cyanosphaera (strain ATCC 29371 / PCC 7437) TaxID=111780 RepID=K9Y1Z7_STAC7|nr:DNA polymerase III subunit beta [Stanieria cyanosphaera]AFZ38012.1 DNA polymerase III, beta subunit [Stanieria cyanosphaera PCC 7437]
MTETIITKERKRRTTSTISSRKKTTNSTTKASKTEPARSESSESTRTEIELSCARTDLETALTYVRKGVPQNPHHPLLHHVSLVADSESNTLELTTNSLDFGMNTKIKAKVSQAGRLTVSLEVLDKLIKKFPQGQIKLTAIVTEVTKEKDSNWQGDSCQLILAPDNEDAQFELEACLGDEFPTLPQVTSRLLTIPASILLKQISSALISVATKQDNKMLTGVRFKFTVDAKNLARIDTISTDSSRLTFTTSLQPMNKVKLTTDTSFTLSAKVLKELKNNLTATSSEQQIRVYYDELESSEESQAKSAAIMFAWDDKRIVALVMQGDYPDLSAVREMVDKNDKIAVFNRLTLLQSLQRLAVLSEGKNKILHISLADERANFKVQRSGIGKGRESHSIVMSGEAASIHFNIKNLIDIVSTIESDEVCLKLLDSQSPCLIEAYGTYESSTIPVKVEHIIAPLLVE